MQNRTLAVALDPKSNSLNALRLALAVLVIVSHSWPVGGWGADPGLGDLSLGHLAVAGFFAISGYLITQSRLRSPLGSYLWRRFLRIFPGFWVCLLVTAFVFAPIAGMVGAGTWDAGQAVRYVVSNAPMMAGGHSTISDTLAESAFPSSWNASLWTLRWEFLAYLIIGAAVAFGFVRRYRWVWVAAWIASTALSGALLLRGTEGPLQQFGFLITFFLAGAVMLQFRQVIPINRLVAIAATVLLILVCLLQVGSVFASLPVAYLALWIGCCAPAAVRRIGARHDYSYGVYLYAFPIQQLLAMTGFQATGLPAYVIASILLTIPFAVGSWWFVERPALRLKNLQWRQRRRDHSMRRPALPE